MKKLFFLLPVVLLIAAGCAQKSIQTNVNPNTQSTTSDLTEKVKEYLISQGAATQSTEIKAMPGASFPKVIPPNYSFATSAYFKSESQPSKGISYDQWNFDLGTNAIVDGHKIGSCVLYTVATEQQVVDLVKEKLGKAPTDVYLNISPKYCFWYVSSPLPTEQGNSHYIVSDDGSVQAEPKAVPVSPTTTK
jgi:hypothetical protein